MSAYHAAQESRRDAMYGTGQTAEIRARKLTLNTNDRELGVVESARLRMLGGDFQGSSSVLGPELEQLFDDAATGPVLKKREIGGQVLAGTITDDLSIPYGLPNYELLFALQYQAVNSLMVDSKENARVYLKRATAMQEQLKEENAETEEPECKQENRPAADKAIDAVQARIDPIAATVRASYENALAWYLMGLFLECEGDGSNAGIAYSQASEIAPGIAGYAHCGGPGDVIVVYEEGLVDMRQPIKVPLPIGGTLISCDFPVYTGDPYVPASLQASFGTNAVPLVKAVDVQALACRDLKDRIPGIVVRNVTRTAVKVAAQQVANHIDTGNSIANLAFMLGVLAFNVCSTVVSEADTRCWQTLPECVQVARLSRTVSDGVLTIRNDAAGRSLEVPLPADVKGPLLVWVSDVCGYSTISVMPLGGGASQWKKEQSLIGDGNGRFR